LTENKEGRRSMIDEEEEGPREGWTGGIKRLTESGERQILVV